MVEKWRLEVEPIFEVLAGLWPDGAGITAVLDDGAHAAW
jgi:hypothetical protein